MEYLQTWRRRLGYRDDAIEWAKKVEALGAGEILLTSMDCDGTKAGYDLALTRAIVFDAVSISGSHQAVQVHWSIFMMH